MCSNSPFKLERLSWHQPDTGVMGLWWEKSQAHTIMDTDSRYSMSVYNLYTMPWTVLAFLIFPPMETHICRLDETELPVLGGPQWTINGPSEGSGPQCKAPVAPSVVMSLCLSPHKWTSSWQLLHFAKFTMIHHLTSSNGSTCPTLSWTSLNHLLVNNTCKYI